MAPAARRRAEPFSLLISCIAASSSQHSTADIWQLYCAIINCLRNMPKSVYSAHKGSFLHACHTFLTCQLLRAQAAKSCAHAKQPQKILRARALATLALFGISFKGAGIWLSSAGMHMSARSSPLPPNPRPTNHRGTHSRFHKEIITLVSCSRFTPILQPRLLANRISLLLAFYR